MTFNIVHHKFRKHSPFGPGHQDLSVLVGVLALSNLIDIERHSEQLTTSRLRIHRESPPLANARRRQTISESAEALPIVFAMRAAPHRGELNHLWHHAVTIINNCEGRWFRPSFEPERYVHMLRTGLVCIIDEFGDGGTRVLVPDVSYASYECIAYYQAEFSFFDPIFGHVIHLALQAGRCLNLVHICLHLVWTPFRTRPPR